MRTATVLVTRRCNQRCEFCDQVDPQSTDRERASIRADLQRIAKNPVDELVFTGGEPLARADFLQIIADARALGMRSIVVETNATLIKSVDEARMLQAAGATAVRISLVTSSPKRHLEIVGSATRPGHVFRGIQSCIEVGLDVMIRLPVAAGVPPAAGRLMGLTEVMPNLKSFVLAPIGQGETTMGKNTAMDPADIADEIAEAWDAARKAKVSLSLSAAHVVAPCIVELPLRTRQLLAPFLNDTDGAANEAHAACKDCALRLRCCLSAEQIRRAAGNAIPKPIVDAKPYFRPGRSAGARLHVLGAREVETFYHVDYDYGVEVQEPTSRIGIIYRCNQVCTFCELADMDVNLNAEKIRGALDSARARGSRRVILTGGEPTLSPDLEGHIQHAAKIGFERIEMQTNAVLLDRPERAKKLREAGLTHAQISLHGPDSAISDRLTAAPGTHARTLAGIDALLENGIRCLLNHLIFKDNQHLLDAFIDMIDARWSAYKEFLTIQFHSARNEFVGRDEALAHIARYTDYAPALQRAVNRGRAMGYAIHDLQDPTGIPALCVLDADEAFLGPILAQSAHPRFHAWESDWLTHIDACKSCSVRNACMGIPKYYLALHGEAEFHPIRHFSNSIAVAPVTRGATESTP